jgi:hypothetical protein
MRGPEIKRRRASPRPSILDTVTLSDGRLAWPLAQAAGMSEAVFRGRLKKGLSPDQALAMPYQPQDRERVAAHRAERAEHAQRRREERQAERAARESLWSGPSHLHALHEDYWGVIWAQGDSRLTVSASGTLYSVQAKRAGAWEDIHKAPSVSELRKWLAVIALDPAPELVALVKTLPENPATYLDTVKSES